VPETAQAARSDPEGLTLHVLGDGIFATHPLPLGRAVLVGRSADADVHIDHAVISRKHARIHTGLPLSLEDLGSVNGTRVGGRRIEPGEIVPIAPGDVISLGSIALFIARSGVESDTGARDGTSAGDSVQANVVVSAPQMQHLYQLVDRIAGSLISVLIFGETGVGKEVMAETLHRRSPRANKPLLRLNCGALSDTLLESELFGYEKGAFTGAVQTKIGLIESADGGTVFLDEIGEMPTSLQVKLLRVIEERKFMRVGGLRSRPVDVRYIAATHREIEADIARGAFRQDLFFRLNGISLTIPPLRERVSEIEGLTRLFLSQACQRAERPSVPKLSDEALAILQAHDWPGNIRELRNVIERAFLLCAGDTITREHLPLQKTGARLSRTSSPQSGGSLPTRIPPGASPPEAALRVEVASSPHRGTDATEEPVSTESAPGPTERQRILDALERCAGNQTHAARLLGISRGTLLSRIELYGLPRPRSRRGQEK
jgi:two-component system, NtrC family, response regulator AtoC